MHLCCYNFEYQWVEGGVEKYKKEEMNRGMFLDSFTLRQEDESNILGLLQHCCSALTLAATAALKA